ncbi:HEAT repeat domain-containing protein [Deinococcus sp. A31D244]|uniref:HEAT repeat domain-containing protein n=1 Tax=Deinococcus sp. A31D244 TaxID=3397675 RepID=UPI0039E07EDE
MNLHPSFFRMVIRPEFDREAYSRFIYFERLYHGIGGVRPNTVPHINFETIESDDAETIAITYRDDALVGLNWVQVTYLQPDHPEAQTAFDYISSRLKEKLPTYTLDVLTQMYGAAPQQEDGERLFAVYATAVGAPWAYDEAVLHAMEKYARDATATVRAGVVVGIGYLGQTEYLPLLECLAQDESEDVRHRAQEMLASFTSWQRARAVPSS